MEELLKNSEALEEKKPWETFGYQEVNQIIKGQFIRAQDAVVTIGYYLRRVYNEQLYHDGGYGSFEDYAREEYGISRSTASRYMDINREFSIDGNSPRIDDRYRNFNKSQLQEMLYLTEEQREQVDVGMTVKEIRQLRHDEEIEEASDAQEQEIQEPSFQLEFETDDGAVDIPEDEPKTIEFEIEIENLEPEPAEEPETSQDSLERKGGCPPEVPGYRRQEWRTSLQAQATGKIECDSCWAEWERQNKILNEGSVKACATSQQAEPEQSQGNVVVEEEMQKKLIAQEVSIELENDSEPAEDGAETKETVSGTSEYMINAELTEVTELEQGTSGQFEPDEVERPEFLHQNQYTPRYFLEEQQGKLDEILTAFADEVPEKMPWKMIERETTIAAALAELVSKLEAVEQMAAEKPKQPELPLLKNNEQRAAFVDTYETWPLWIETELTGERYYRYDLEDGTSMVVKVYLAMLFDYKVTWVKYEDRYTEGYGQQEYYLLRPGKFFKDCEVNRSMLIEKLKEIQKK